MIYKNKDGVVFGQFPGLARVPGIWHGIFTRHTGRSRGAFRSLNVGFGVGDDHRNVVENRRIIARAADGRDLVFADQVHGARVLAFKGDGSNGGVVAVEEVSERALPHERPHAGELYESFGGRELVGDAMVSDVRDKCLVVQVADCQSVLMVDPVARVVANVHSGWRSSIQNIIGKTVRAMENIYGCRAGDVLAGVGPSLGECCAQFVNYRTEIPAGFWKYKNARDCFDFWSVSRDQLCAAGVLAENIEFSGVCTRCDTRNFFSYRGEGTTGRFAAVIGLT